MGKSIMNGRMLEAHINGNIEYGKIECTGYNEYHFYNDEGEGYSIAKLDAVQVFELFLTGDVKLSDEFVIINTEHTKS